MADSLDITLDGNRVFVKVSGKLNTADYEQFVPVIEQLLKAKGKIRVLFEIHDFQGWTAGALWEDLKFDYQHWSDIERVAIVGETRLEEAMSVFCKPFTAAKVQYFDHAKLDEAKAWLAAA